MSKSLHFLSHEKKLSFNQGYVVPIGCIEALPGDIFQHKVAALLRTQPMLAPVMHTATVKIHHWFVPLRLIWDDFEKFITGGKDGLDASVAPTLDTGTIVSGDLSNHLGLPAGASLSVSALPFRAYAHIWNEYYRDQDLQTELPISTASGVDTTTSKVLKRACWEKDYFTSARPTTQKGLDVEIPLSGTAPIKGIGKSGTASAAGGGTRYETDGTTPTYGREVAANTVTAGAVSYFETDAAGKLNLRADLSNISAVSLNDLRLALRLQQYKENMLRKGSRMVERLQHAFGIKPEDTRLDIAEYLGGGKQVLQFSEVLQTAQGSNPVGTLAGHGIAAMQSNRYRKFITEYGFVLSFVIVRPKTAYMDGMHKMWHRTVKEDYFQPELQNIGMQPIKNKEIFARHGTPNGTFGYQDRDDSYRHMFDQVSGELAGTLDFWHMGRKFASAPALNSAFVEYEGVDRVFAAPVADDFIGRFKHDLRVKRLVHQSGRPSVF